MDPIFNALLISVGVCLRLLPFLVALKRKHPRSGLVFLINLVPVVGWMGAMLYLHCTQVDPAIRRTPELAVH